MPVSDQANDACYAPLRDECDGVYPNSKGWMDTIAPYTKNESLFHDVHAEAEGGYGYACNENASGVVTSDDVVSGSFLLIFDSELVGRSAHGNARSIPPNGRHDGWFSRDFRTAMQKHLKHTDFEATL